MMWLNPMLLWLYHISHHRLIIYLKLRASFVTPPFSTPISKRDSSLGLGGLLGS